MRNKAALVTATLALAGGLAGTPAAASASPAPPQRADFGWIRQGAVACPKGYLCLWQDSGFRGRRLIFRDAGHWQDLGRWNFRYKTSSYWNRRGDDAAFQWSNGRKTCVDGGEYNSDMGKWNDHLKRVYLAHTGRNC